MKTRTRLFFCVLLSFFVMSVVVPVSYTERRPEKDERAAQKEKRREEKRKRSAEKKKENEALKKKIEQIEAEKEEEGKIDRLKRWVGALPVIGDVGEAIIEEVAEKVAPRADCPRCSDKVWKTTDHRQTCYNAGHPDGVYTFYSCENSGRCTNESVHTSRPLDPVLSNYSLCNYCSKKVYDGGSHQCSSN